MKKIFTLGITLIYLIRGLLPGKRGVTILAYHSVGHDTDLHTISPQEFEWQLNEIIRKGYTIISMYEMEKKLKEQNLDGRYAVLTFDDGRKDNYIHVFPLICNHKLPITIFLPSFFLNKELPTSGGKLKIISEEEAREMHESGLVDFEPHSHTHIRLPELNPEELLREVKTSKEFIEQMFHKECKYFAYPHGRYSTWMDPVLKALGVSLAVGTKAGIVTARSHVLNLPRNGIDRNVSKFRFESILKRGKILYR